MKWQRHELVGRRAELDELRRHSEEPALLVVRGPAGSGKTAVLRRFRAECAGAVLDLGGGPVWDEFRAGALLTAVRADFEAFGVNPRVAEAIEAVSRLCVPQSYATPGSRHRLLGAISVLLTRIRVRLVIVVDDADEVPVSALAPMHRAGHTVVAACGTTAPRELCSLADVVVDLAPLTNEEIGRLLWQVAAAPVDEAVPRALRDNLGPLCGNAGTLVSTVESLLDEGRLAKVHGVLALRAPRAPIALPSGHRLLDELDALGRVLVGLAACESGFRVDQIPELAESSGHSALDFGHAVDRLVRAGVLVHEANGRLRCRARAIGATVAEPSHPVVPSDRLSRQFIAEADYEGLAAFVADVVARAGGVFDDAGERDELAAAAALAAMHTGQAVSDAVRNALAGDALALADRWFAGARLRVADVAESLGRLARPVRGVLDGHADTRDLVPVLRSVLGPLYRTPTGGPLAAYHRVCRGYADGDWADALSAARELEFLSVGEPVLDAARLLAAEICGWRGEDRQAAAWLAAVGEDTLFPGLRGWVATGLLDQDSADALSYGWDWYTAHAERLEEPGAARLLTRLASLATDTGDRYRARAVLRAALARYGPESETCLLVRGLVDGDGASVRAVEPVVRARGTRFELAFACQRLAHLSGEPRPWLSEAYELARSMGAAKLVTTTRRAMEGCGVAVPVRRVRQSDVSDVELRIIELIRSGKTNRQIALSLRVSSKTVEKHLTRLFAKAGCRTRHALAMSGLGARQELVGA
ncbi:helix-turn-helix transcriptional regulator [Actinophytocola oryzae]|uniref:Regulatory LuxR family protein n=1 Tax=Actinophytocola oryzae TaxID=502181 RepID=A0A4R7V0Z1_9PSEU|nr:LuxR family transcriptional regulator [Actinophytocola oryzae]TDV42157.1 regulatory LuxR family protein [Actinophytocola oryzae]